MYRAFKVTLKKTTKTVPKLLFGTTTTGGRIKNLGSAQDPVPIVIKNSSATFTILVGASTKTECIFPVKPGTTISFGIISGDSIYARATGTHTVTVYVLVGRQ